MFCNFQRPEKTVALSWGQNRGAGLSILGAYLRAEGSCWAGGGAFLGGAFEGLGEGLVEWWGDLYVETAADEGHAEFLLAFGGEGLGYWLHLQCSSGILAVWFSGVREARRR